MVTQLSAHHPNQPHNSLSSNSPYQVRFPQTHKPRLQHLAWDDTQTQRCLPASTAELFLLLQAESEVRHRQLYLQTLPVVPRAAPSTRPVLDPPSSGLNIKDRNRPAP